MLACVSHFQPSHCHLPQRNNCCQQQFLILLAGISTLSDLSMVLKRPMYTGVSHAINPYTGVHIHVENRKLQTVELIGKGEWFSACIH